MGQNLGSNDRDAYPVKRNRPLRIAMYDPSGQGGICHYTFQLAECLAQSGCDITVITADGYELQDLRRNFNVHLLFKKSWVKSCLLKIVPQLLNKHAKTGGAKVQPVVSQVIPEIGNGDPAKSRAAIVERAVPDNEIGTRRQIILGLLRRVRLRILLLRAAGFLLWTQPDVVHLQWLADRKIDGYFIKLLTWLRFKVVYTVHDLLPQDEDITKNRIVFQKLYKLADRLIVHAGNNKKELVEIFDIDPHKVHVIPHGSNDFFYSDRNLSKENARQELGIPENKKVILFFGLIKRYKGLEYLVQAFREVQRSTEDAILLIAGNIYSLDKPGFDYYSELIESLRHDENVICRDKYIPFDKVGSYFTASDVVVLPYVKTYTSGVLLCAYAAGRPVVVTNTGGLSDVVEDGKSGFVVPPRDAHALAESVVKTIQSSEQLQEMGNRAKYLAATIFSWQKAASATIDLYHSLLTASDLHSQPCLASEETASASGISAESSLRRFPDRLER